MDRGVPLETDRTAQVWYSSELNPGDEIWFHQALEPEYKLSRQSDILIEESASSTNQTVINIDPGREYQTIIGFGTSLEGSSLSNLNRMSDNNRASALRALVDPDDGIGLNLIRVSCGTSDYCNGKYYTYDDVSYGETDEDLAEFSISKDISSNTISTLSEALGYNNDIKFVFSPWSPPAWMKTSESLCAGSLKDEYYSVAAQYYRMAIQAYENQGLPISIFTLQNEPGYGPTEYPSCTYDWEDEMNLAVALKSELASHNLTNTGIAILDHNFDMAISYAKQILDDADGNDAADFIAVHDYSGSPELASDLHYSYPDKQIVMTERSVYGTRGADRMITYLRNWVSGTIWWVPFLDSDQEPNNGPWNTETSLLVQDADDVNTYWETADYLVFPSGALNISQVRFQQMMHNREPSGTATFETGSFSGWTEWKPQGQSSKYAISTENPHGGTYCLELWDNHPYRQGVYKTFSGLKTGQYTISVWVKQDIGQPSICQMEVEGYGGSKIITPISHGTNYSLIQTTVT